MTPRRYRLGYNTSGFSRTPDLDVVIDSVAKSGFEAIEISFDPVHLHPDRCSASRAEAIRRRIAAAGLSVVCGAGARHALGERPHLPAWVSGDPSECASRQKFLESSIRLAAALKSPWLVFHSGPLPEGTPREEGDRRLREGLSHLLRVARTFDVGLALEFHPSMLVSTLAEAERLVADFPDLGLTLDVGHLRCTEDGSLSEGIRRAAAITRHVHLEDIRGRVHRHLPIGEGEMPFAQILAVLSETRFSGVVATEFHSGELLMEEGGDGGEVILARRTFERLRPLLPPVSPPVPA